MNRNYNLVQSFVFALSGIAYALTHERNLRIHSALGVYVIYFSKYYGFSNTEYAVILLLIGFVLTCEMINTAIEKKIDLETLKYNPLAKISKDVAAGAVLVSAVTATASGFLLFYDIDIIKIIWGDILKALPVWILLAALTLFWILLPEGRKGKQ